MNNNIYNQSYHWKKKNNKMNEKLTIIKGMCEWGGGIFVVSLELIINCD